MKATIVVRMVGMRSSEAMFTSTIVACELMVGEPDLQEVVVRCSWEEKKGNLEYYMVYLNISHNSACAVPTIYTYSLTRLPVCIYQITRFPGSTKAQGSCD
jgi:hypothetical protein